MEESPQNNSECSNGFQNKIWGVPKWGDIGKLGRRFAISPVKSPFSFCAIPHRSPKSSTSASAPPPPPSPPHTHQYALPFYPFPHRSLLQIAPACTWATGSEVRRLRRSAQIKPKSSTGSHAPQQPSQPAAPNTNVRPPGRGRYNWGGGGGRRTPTPFCHNICHEKNNSARRPAATRLYMQKGQCYTSHKAQQEKQTGSDRNALFQSVRAKSTPPPLAQARPRSEKQRSHGVPVPRQAPACARCM